MSMRARRSAISTAAEMLLAAFGGDAAAGPVGRHRRRRGRGRRRPRAGTLNLTEAGKSLRRSATQAADRARRPASHSTGAIGAPAALEQRLAHDPSRHLRGGAAERSGGDCDGHRPATAKVNDAAIAGTGCRARCRLRFLRRSARNPCRVYALPPQHAALFRWCGQAALRLPPDGTQFAPTARGCSTCRWARR